MHVRPHRPSVLRAPRPRRGAAAPVRDEAAAPTTDRSLAAERRHRASVAPEDAAHYACSCGFQFQAAVTTSVACPHCGTGQAW